MPCNLQGEQHEHAAHEPDRDNGATHDTLRDSLPIDKTLVPVLTVKRGRVFEPEWGPHPWGWEPERAGG